MLMAFFEQQRLQSFKGAADCVRVWVIENWNTV